MKTTITFARCKAASALIALGLALQAGQSQAATTYALKDYSWPLYPGNYWIYSHMDATGQDWLRRVDSVSAVITNYTGRTTPVPFTQVAADVYGAYGSWEGGSQFTPSANPSDIWDDYMGLGDAWGMYGDDEYDDSGAQMEFRANPGAVTTNRLAVGQTVTVSGNAYLDGKYQGTVSVAVKLVGISNVTVPMGTYNGCLHVTQSFTFGGSTSVNEEWWARGVGTVKEIHKGKTIGLAVANFVVPPRISAQPQGAVATAGSTVILSVSAMGTDPLGYQWRRGNTNLAETEFVSGVVSNTLTISAFSSDAVGAYTVVVTNAYGSVTSAPALLSVRPPETVKPTLAITVPKPATTTTNGVLTLQGIARDNVGVSNVLFQLNGTGWNAATPVNGWSNWTGNATLVPGTNIIQACAVDTSGNHSSISSVSCFYLVPAPLQLQITGRGTLTPNYTNGQLLALGRTYSVTAAGTAGYAFSGWVISTNWSGGVTSTIPALKFMMESDLTLQANFKDVTRPTLGITNPVSLQQLGYPSVSIKGWAKDNAQVAKVQYRLGNGDWANAVGTTAWSGNIDGLVPGATNALSAYAQDSSGLCSVTSVVKVVYNQFLPVNGTYNGLFSASEVVADRQHESSGFLKLTVSGKGSYTGSFVLAGKTNSLGTGHFDASGHASKSVGTGINLVVVAMNLNLAPGSDQLTGTLSGIGWQASLVADRAVFVTTNKAPYAGKYTLVFPGATDESAPTTPVGVGYGAVTVDSLGKVVLSGSLADGTALSQGTTVSRDGRWPLYASLNGGKGSIWGWVQFTNSLPPDLLGGEVSWIKEVQPATVKYYRVGFTNVLETQGSLYVTPSNATMRVIGLTNGVVSFVGGNVSVPFTNQVALGANNVVTNQGANKLTLSLSKANGTFTGTVVVPGAKTSTTFKGAVLQDEAVGWGYFLGTNQSGRVEFQGER